MARYLYDVNRTTRFFDVHKQFQGGLKTVDTDDALGAVFLRESQNVSLSEFGFIEKRYGTYLNNKVQLTGTLQGYFEFKGYKIYVVDNTFYVDGNPVSEILKETEDEQSEENYQKEWRYPTLPAYPFVLDQEVGYRDMNAVNINEVLYIFTGYYPVYAKVVAGGLKFYWFSVDIPTYDEIVVTGHNLLEDDYEGLYFSQTSTVTQPTTDYNPGLSFPEIIESNFSPKFPNSKEDIKFHFATKYPQDMNAFGKQSNQNYYEIKLDSIAYRTTLPGASDLAFLEVDIDEADFTTKSNYSVIKENYVSEEDDLATRGDNIFSQQPFSNVFYKQSTFSSVSEKFEYRINIDFEISREDFLKNNKYLIELFRFNSIDFEPFLLKDYNETLGATFNSYGTKLRETTLKITPVDYNDNVLKTETVVLDLYENSDYSFDIPSNLNKNLNIKKYIFEFFTTDTAYVDTDNIGIYDELSDIKTNPENYYYNLVTVETKKPVFNGEGNTITSSSVPNLDFTLSNLLSGNYDFRVRFVREEWERVTENGQFVRLELVQKEFFETIISDVRITPERFQDYPGAENVPIKFKPVWTCNKVIEHFGKLMIWGSREMPTAVFYSFPDRPFYFPSKFYLDFQNDEGSAIQNITPYMNILVAQTEDRTWGIRGNSGLIDSPAPYTPFTINPTVGTIAYKSVRPVRNHLFFLSKQGIIALKSLYAADEQYNIEFVDRNIRNIVPQDKNAVGIQYDNQYWLNFPNFGITLRWYIDKKAWVKDVFAWEDFKGVFKWQNVDGKLEFITYPNALQEDTNDYVYKIGVDESLPADMGSNILTKFETSFLNQNYPFHQKNYKEFKYDFTMQNEYNFSRDPIYDKTFEITDEVSVLNLQASGLTQPLLRNHTYMLSFSDVVEVDTVEINGVLIENLQKFDGSYYLDGNTDYFFVMPNSLNGKFDVDIQLTTPLQGIDERVSLRDTTYDETMVFLSKVITEERNVINQQLPIGYTEQQESIEINLADFQDFTLGTTFFGDRITFIKTIKLSGKGYNTKAYFEDVSKAKWTIESMGITYKMKRARGD